MRPEQLIAESSSEEERAIMRADLTEVVERMEELQGMEAWRRLLGNQQRVEWAVMIQALHAYLRALE